MKQNKKGYIVLAAVGLVILAGIVMLAVAVERKKADQQALSKEKEVMEENRELEQGEADDPVTSPEAMEGKEDVTSELPFISIEFDEDTEGTGSIEGEKGDSTPTDDATNTGNSTQPDDATNTGNSTQPDDAANTGNSTQPGTPIDNDNTSNQNPPSDLDTPTTPDDSENEGSEQDTIIELPFVPAS